MFLIPCPYCGPREESEFAYGGEGHIARPANQDAMSDEEWKDYLFMRKNPKGPHSERWMHARGCRRWFNLLRDTYTHRIYGSYRMGEPPPAGFATDEHSPAGQSPGSVTAAPAPSP